MSIELVSYADLKSLLDLGDAAITDYPALDVLRDSVTSAFEAYTGRLLEPIARTKSIYVGQQSTSMIRLDAIPISSVASLTVTIAGDAETYTENDDYEIAEYGLRLYSGVKNAVVAVTYTGGMSAVPDTMNRAALLQIAYEFQSKDQIGAESVSTEGGAVQRPALGLLKELKRLLNPSFHPLRW